MLHIPFWCILAEWQFQSTSLLLICSIILHSQLAKSVNSTRTWNNSFFNFFFMKNEKIMFNRYSYHKCIMFYHVVWFCFIEEKKRLFIVFENDHSIQCDNWTRKQIFVCHFLFILKYFWVKSKWINWVDRYCDNSSFTKHDTRYRRNFQQGSKKPMNSNEINLLQETFIQIKWKKIVCIQCRRLMYRFCYSSNIQSN